MKNYDFLVYAAGDDYLQGPPSLMMLWHLFGPTLDFSNPAKGIANA